MACNGLKMGSFHLFRHPQWSRIIFGSHFLKSRDDVLSPTSSVPIFNPSFGLGLSVAIVHKFWAFWGPFRGSSRTCCGVRGP